jgi:hypothetical protein
LPQIWDEAIAAARRHSLDGPTDQIGA